MRKLKHIVNIGETFGQLTVIGEMYNDNSYYKAPCLCTCGKATTPTVAHLVQGKTKSCGGGICSGSFKEDARTRDPLYQIYMNIKYRLKNPVGSNSCYEGLDMFIDWVHDFELFKIWATSNGYSKELTIDRINTNIGYYPDNCRWVTDIIQSQNRRKTSKNTTGYKGVYKHKTGKKPYYTYIIHKGVRKELHGFISAEEAAIARENYIKDNFNTEEVYAN